MKHRFGHDADLHLPLLLCVALILHQPALSSAEIYKWTDENGRIHYGDRPQGDQASQIHITEGPPLDASLDQRMDHQQRLLDVLENDRIKAKQTRTDEMATVAKRLANCELAKKMLEAMQNSSFLYEKTADPYNPRVLTATEADAALAKARNDVKLWCIRGDSTYVNTPKLPYP